MALRISSIILILLSVLFMPFWLTLILTVFAMFYFDFFIEGVVLFFISDLLYGIEGEKLFGMMFLSTILALILLGVLQILKKRLKFYPR
jgi:hypothetical protein